MSNIKKSLYRPNMTKKFCDYLLARGYEVGYYFNPDYKNRGLINTSALSKYYTWLAYYTSKTQKGYGFRAICM